MELVLYDTMDDENVINKELIERYRFDINFKDLTNIINPDLKLRFNDVSKIANCNYAELSEFNRYYFIRTIQNVNNDIWLLNLECDVLETYKEEILNSQCQFTRTLKNGDYQDINVPVDVRKDVFKYESNVELKEGSDMILSVMSGREG